MSGQAVQTETPAGGENAAPPSREIAIGRIGFWLSLVPYGLLFMMSVMAGLGHSLEAEWIQVISFMFPLSPLFGLTIAGSYAGGLILSLLGVLRNGKRGFAIAGLVISLLPMAFFLLMTLLFSMHGFKD